ncbi:MAG: response regulator [Polyangiaceae bacterium]
MKIRCADSVTPEPKGSTEGARTEGKGNADVRERAERPGATSVEEPVVESSRASIAPLRVLLIEENAITRRLARLALESNGIAVSESSDGQTALSFLAANGVDLVLQDLVLPDMDGFALLTHIRALPGGAEMPIVALSGLLSKFEEARVSSVGFNDVITKPVEPGHLLQIVRAHLPTEEPREVKFGRGRRLLVADDDPVQRKLLCFRLRRLGFDTATAADGNEALALARRSHPDAIISDVMMPGLDGFGLCVAVREDPALARTPLLLITNSYIEEVDRDLARKAGASGFVVRTPGMREVAEALRQSLSQSPRAPVPREPAATLEGEWSRRVMSQLERQVSLNAGIAQRCATLSAELSILSGISDALARQQHIEDALVDVLGTCFDASGITSSALYLRDGDRTILHKFGAWGQSGDEEVRSFFGHPELLADFMAIGKTLRVPSESAPAAIGDVLRGAGMASAILAPVLRRGEVIGGLLMGSRTSELVDDDRLLFAEGVATQISQALALSHSFREMDLSERRAREQAAVLRSILESIAEGVVVTNREGEVVIWNLAAEGILRKGAITVPARDWTEHYGLFLPDTLMPVPPSQSPFLRAMAGDSVDSMELVLRHDAVPQGRHISISARPLKDENDDVAGAVAVLRDITAERATQTQLMVTDRLASVGMLAAGVAHEINNPLAAVLGNLEVALERLSDFGVPVEKQAELTELTAALRDARDRASRPPHIGPGRPLMPRAAQ